MEKRSSAVVDSAPKPPDELRGLAELLLRGLDEEALWVVFDFDYPTAYPEELDELRAFQREVWAAMRRAAGVLRQAASAAEADTPA